MTEGRGRRMTEGGEGWQKGKKDDRKGRRMTEGGEG